MTTQVEPSVSDLLDLTGELPPEGEAPGRRPEVEFELTNRYHVDWTFHAGVKVSAFDFEKSQHNQARFNPIDQPTVDIYAEAVKRGDVFPAVIAYRPQPRARLVMVDGNHRLGAHIVAGKPLDVYEIDRSTHPRTIALLTFAMNTRHGRPTSEVERIHHAMYLVDNGASAGSAAAAVNIPIALLRRAITRGKADQRADIVGLRRNEWDALTVAVKTRLVNVSTDEGFRAAANLAYVAKLDTGEVMELVSQLNDSKSGTRQEAIVKAHREVSKERIQGTGSGVLGTSGKRHLNPKHRTSMAIAQVLALPEDAAILKTYAAPERMDAAAKMREAGTRLIGLADALWPMK